jgi:hypothetical protein
VCLGSFPSFWPGRKEEKKLVLMPSERVAAAAAARLVLFAEDVSPRFLIFDGEKKERLWSMSYLTVSAR